MVKTFQAYLPNKCHRTYSCVHCRAHLANHDELISKGLVALYFVSHSIAYREYPYVLPKKENDVLIYNQAEKFNMKYPRGFRCINRKGKINAGNKLRAQNSEGS